MEILIKDLQKKTKISKALIKRVVKATLAHEGCLDGQVSIVLCDDGYIQRLNREYRQVDEPTDVLSFSMTEGKFSELNPQLLGDVVVSLETASRLAARYRHSPSDEVALLVAHGLLHLLGYNHGKARDAKLMRHKEKETLKELGIK